MAKTISISGIRLQHEAGRYRVSADINGERLWFESQETPLVASPEGFVAAFLLSAMEKRKNIVVDAPLDPVFLANVDKLMAIYRQWWGLRPVRITSRCPGANECYASDCLPAETEGRTGTGVFFTAGGDSFYTLRHYQDSPITHLINIHGYDIPLDQESRFEGMKICLDAVAKDVGAQPVMIKSNLREHGAFSRIWSRAHGGALVAAAFMVPGIERLVISASYPYVYHRPWGTHWETDYLWGTRKMSVSHFGAERWRTEKLRELKDDAVAQQHLRVCWELKNEHVNCCRCEKCFRTMLAFNQSGVLEKFKTFQSADLAEIADSLPPLPDQLVPVYRRYMEESALPDLKSALESLIRRSDIAAREAEARALAEKGWRKSMQRFASRMVKNLAEKVSQ